MSALEIPVAELSTWTAGSPVVRAEAPPDGELPALGIRRSRAWAVAFLRPTHAHGVNLMLHGEDSRGGPVGPAAVPVLEELVTSAAFAPWLVEARAKGATGVSLPRAAEDLGGLLAEVGGQWEFMSTTTAPPAATTPGLQELSPEHRQEVVDFLGMHNPGTDGQPFARPSQRWVGIRDDAGHLLGVGSSEPEVSGAPVLAGITVSPAARGRGLGRAITAELTRGAVAAHGWSTLGMYSHNDTARRLYLSLGYETHAVWTSGRLA